MRWYVTVGGIAVVAVVLAGVFFLGRCTGPVAPEEQPTPRATPTVENGNNNPVVVDNCYMWEVNHEKESMVWNGPTDGSVDVCQGGEFLGYVRGGYTVEFELNTPFVVEICRGNFEGPTVREYTDCRFGLEFQHGDYIVTVETAE